jgi:endonuclease/exonuclease/phosphatase family metal-dependent hydrolase
MTYNIRYDNPGDGQNTWSLRRDWLTEQIKSTDPAILCIQEGLIQQLRFLDKKLKKYKRIGVGRDDGREKGEFSAIYYDTKRIRLLQQGTFWLSPTPEKASVGWDAALERICTYGRFLNRKTGKKFWAFNTHFDHMGVEARKNSAILILQKIKSLNIDNLPVVLMGDFNTGPESEPIRQFLTIFRDAKEADKTMNMSPDGTFNAFNPEKPATERIDFIFTGFGFQAVNYFVIREKREGRFASDHFPVIAEIKVQ